MCLSWSVTLCSKKITLYWIGKMKFCFLSVTKLYFSNQLWAYFKWILPSRGSRLATTPNYILFFKDSLPWHQFTLADIRVLRSSRKLRLMHAPLRNSQQPSWRLCCFRTTSVVVHTSFSEANSDPRVLGQENKGEAAKYPRAKFIGNPLVHVCISKYAGYLS